MEISYSTHAGGMEVTQGYGYAGYNIVNSLQHLGHTTPFNKADSLVGFNFTQPYYYQYHKNQYLIGYTPWESSGLMDGWVDAMNAMDEVWTTSDLCQQWFREAGVIKPVKIFEHGIEHIWQPCRRRKARQLKFLHVGEPATRKCGQMAFNAFMDLFGRDDRYAYTIKANGYNSVRTQSAAVGIGDPNELPNVNVIKDVISVNDLITLYNNHHVLVYPSYGEGFGFIPLQAMASGMPTILNPTWAPYRRFSVGLDVKDAPVPSRWPEMHPGTMLEPDYESLKQQMQRAADDFETFADQAYELAPQIHDEYDWNEVTKTAFAGVVKRFS